MYQPNQQYTSDLGTAIREEIEGDPRKYHKSGSQTHDNPMDDYQKNDEYMKNEDSPDQEYHKVEEEEEKKEESPEEFEEEDKKYDSNEESDEETDTKSSDDGQQQSEGKKKKAIKKKSTIEDAILKAQQEIKSMD